MPRGPFISTGIAPNPANRTADREQYVVHEYVHALTEDLLVNLGFPIGKQPKDPFIIEGIAEYLSQRFFSNRSDAELKYGFSEQFVLRRMRPDFVRRRYSLAPAYLAAIADSLQGAQHPQPVREAVRRFVSSPPCLESVFTRPTGQVR